MIKRITLAAIATEIGVKELPLLTAKQCQMLVFGAEKILGDRAWKDRKVHEVHFPPDAALRKLARKLMA